jgi:2-polyprenyl-3-methyl-5-hydroxy-6-metoxy-1,4-benzoquinol methylase
MQFHELPCCPICDSADVVVAFQTDEAAKHRFVELSERKYGAMMNDWIRSTELDVSRCRSCDHLWFRHQPDQASLIKMYESSKPLTPGAKRPEVPTPRAYHQMRALYELCAKPADRPPRLLDYGSGYGLWARAAREAGFDVTCYEPVDMRADHPSKDPGMIVVNDLAKLQDRFFDVINIEQVLEHVPQPLAVLQTVHRCALPGAMIRIAVPNAKSLLNDREAWQVFPFDGTSPHLLSPYEHLHGFNPRSLRRAIARAGFAPAYRILARKPLYWLRTIMSGTTYVCTVGG